MASQHACRLALKALSSDAVRVSQRRPIVPLFLIERNFAEAVENDPETMATIKHVNDEIGIQWLFSFLSADKRKTYCLYEAPNPEAIRAAARRLGVPADTIVEVGSEIGPLAAAITPLREQVGASTSPSA
jgi:hypothetical protein